MLGAFAKGWKLQGEPPLPPGARSSDQGRGPLAGLPEGNPPPASTSLVPSEAGGQGASP